METKDKNKQPVPADPIPTPVDTRHPGEKLEQPVPADPIATPDPVAAAAAAAEKRSVEDWATKHGMLPEVHPGGALKLPPGARGQRSVRVSMARSGEVAPKHNPKFIHFYAAKLHNNWVQGHEMTEAEFLAAVKKAYGPDAEVICR
jgi:hypothetical protein